MELEFFPEKSKFTTDFSLVDETIKLKVPVKKKLDPEQLESAKKLGANVSTLNTYAAGLAEGISVGITFLNLDPSGHLMKLSQMLKTYCRIRFPSIRHGAYLSAYFWTSSEKFDPPSKISTDEVVQKNKSFYRNLVKYKVAFDILEVNFLRAMIYSISWVIKLIAYVALYISVRNNLIGRLKCYFVHISQKVHMIALNSIALDLIPYSIRAIFHTKDQTSIAS